MAVIFNHARKPPPSARMSDVSNLTRNVPEAVHGAVTVLAAHIETQNVPGKDARAAGEKLAELVRQLNVLAQ
jgi:division protein CdvB (Snf7/Vps24/ESCRT-III family)